MKKFVSNIERCYHKIAEKPLSKISSSTIYLSYLYIQSFHDLDNQALIIGIPCKENLDLILSAALLKNFFIEDYLLHSDEHFKKLQLNSGDRIKIFGMPTSWFSSDNSKNGFIKLKQTSQGAYGEKNSSLLPIDIRNEWLPYIEKSNGGTTRIINFHTFYKRLKENRVRRNALDDFLEYNERGFGIPSQALYSKIILVTGRGRKSKTINRLKESKLFGESFFNLFVKNDGLEVLPDLKNYVDCFNPSAIEDFEKFVNYAQKIVESVPEFNSSKLIEYLSRSDIHNEDFLNELEELESHVEDNELHQIKPHIVELNRMYPEKKNEIPENLRCVIINDSNTFLEYQNTIQGFINHGIPVLILTCLEDDSIESSLLNASYRFYFSQEKIKLLINKTENEIYDLGLFEKNKNYLNQQNNIKVFKDHSFEQLISKLSKFFYDVEGFENIKSAYWKVAYPVSYLFKNSPQSNFSEYRELLQNFFSSYSEVKDHLPKDVSDSIEILKTNDWKNEKQVQNGEFGFAQIITINGDTYSYDYQESLIGINRLRDCRNSISFTGIPYREYYQSNIIRALFKYFIPKLNYYLFANEYEITKKRIQDYLTNHLFDDHVPFISGITEEFLLSKSQIEEYISKYFSMSGYNSSNVEVDLVHEDLHKRFIETNRKYFASKTDKDHNVDCLVLAFSNEEWMFVPKHSTLYIASEEDDDLIIISKRPPSQIAKNDLMILYNLDVSELTNLASNNLPLKRSLEELKIWRSIIRKYLEDNSINNLKLVLDKAKTIHESKANPSLQNIRNWSNDEDLIAPMKENLRLILKFGGELDKLDDIYVARKNVITFRNTVRKEIRNKLKNKLPKILLEKNPNSNFALKIFGIDVMIKTREVSFIDRKGIEVPYNNTKRLINE